MTPNDVLASSYVTAKKLVHFMTDDLTPDEFAAQPINGANSIAWIIGHLANVLAITVTRMGGTLPVNVPADLGAKVKTTKQHAEKQENIGSKEELVTIIDTAIDQLVPLLQAYPIDKLSEPPIGRAPFSTNQAESLLFGSTHVAMHVGQITMIRRALGKPPLV